MADEIAQVVEMEYKGVYYLFKGTKEMIAMMARGAKTLHEWNHNKWLEKPGSSSWQKIQEASQGAAPILEFPKEMFEESIDISGDKDIKGKGRISPFEYYCRKNHLRYCLMPDLNPNDDYIPVAVLSQEFGIHDEQIKSYMRKRVESEEKKDKAYDERIDEVTKALEEATGEEKEEIEKNLEALRSAKEENSALLQESKEKMEKGNVLDFAEYIKMADHTKFLSDPDEALRQEKTSGIIPEFTADECMYPIRDSGNMPEGRKLFYMQKCGDNSYLTMERSFEVDEQGCVYSVYHVEGDDENGPIEICDKGCSRQEWKEKLPELFKNSGIYMDQPFGVVSSMDRFRDYLAGVSENFTKARSIGQELSKDSEIEITQAGKDLAQKKAYVRSFYSTLTVPAESVMPSDKQILSLEMGGGLVEGITLVGMDSDQAKISVRSDEKYSFIGADGKAKQITGDEIIKAFDKQKDTAGLREALTKGNAR
ncbi:MAG: hypothetical protein K6E75_03220 [Lachnospiraceae bacterium]|nr:hypothetical protein [Lachnospiraceae bacterium]